MSVVVETTIGDFTIDLVPQFRPKACENFLKLCKMKYYNFSLFHKIERGFIAQTGDPNGSGSGGSSVYGLIHGEEARFFRGAQEPRLGHSSIGTVSFASHGEHRYGSQFFVTLSERLEYLDAEHCVFGRVVEGLDTLLRLNACVCDQEHRPLQDVRITHTVVLEDPCPDPALLRPPSSSPPVTPSAVQSQRVAVDELVEDEPGGQLGSEQLAELVAERETQARATVLEMVGDLPCADAAPPENVLFVCKLNPVTSDDDLHVIFARFGTVLNCQIIRDHQTGASLQYGFVEFDNPRSCELAYFKMDNVLIDDRRIHVDFSQSVSRVRYHGRGRVSFAAGTDAHRLADSFRTGKSQDRPRNHKSDQRLGHRSHGSGRADHMSDHDRRRSGHDSQRHGGNRQRSGNNSEKSDRHNNHRRKDNVGRKSDDTERQKLSGDHHRSDGDFQSSRNMSSVPHELRSERTLPPENSVQSRLAKLGVEKLRSLLQSSDDSDDYAATRKKYKKKHRKDHSKKSRSKSSKKKSSKSSKHRSRSSSSSSD